MGAWLPWLVLAVLQAPPFWASTSLKLLPFQATCCPCARNAESIRGGRRCGSSRRSYHAVLPVRFSLFLSLSLLLFHSNYSLFIWFRPFLPYLFVYNNNFPFLPCWQLLFLKDFIPTRRWDVVADCCQVSSSILTNLQKSNCVVCQNRVSANAICPCAATSCTRGLLAFIDRRLERPRLCARRLSPSGIVVCAERK